MNQLRSNRAPSAPTRGMHSPLRSPCRHHPKPMNGNEKKKIIVSFSDSEESSSSDLPTITTSKFNVLPISLMSDSSSDSEELIVHSQKLTTNEADWSPKKQQQIRPIPNNNNNNNLINTFGKNKCKLPYGAHNCARTVKRTPQRKVNLAHQETKLPNNEDIEKSDQKESENFSSSSISSDYQAQNADSHNEKIENFEEQIQVLNFQQSNSAESPISNHEKISSESQKITDSTFAPFSSPISTQISALQDLPEEVTLQITLDQRTFTPQWRRNVQMTQHDILMYCCESVVTQQYGKVHIICTKKPNEFTSPNFVGMVVRHQKGLRFTLCGKTDQNGKQPQLMGMSFGDSNSKELKVRSFRIAIPEGDYFAEKKSDDLSRIAMNNISTPGVKILNTEIPRKREDGSMALNMGHYSILPSTKNFIIRNSNGAPLFTIFKKFNNICTIKLRSPFTPLIGFAIGVAVSTSSK